MLFEVNIFNQKNEAGTSTRKDGGAEGTRTPYPHNAIVVLYQMSYDPERKGDEDG